MELKQNIIYPHGQKQILLIVPYGIETAHKRARN